MRTYDPPPHTAPHTRITARRRAEAEFEAHQAQLEARYGVPYEKLPDVLKHGPPEHPRGKNARRGNYIVYDRSWHTRWRNEERRRRASKNRNGWKTERQAFLAAVERFRHAEVEVRKQRIVKKGRGKPLPKNHFATRRLAVEDRDFAEKNW